jgi:hypothetical protein
MMVKEGMLQSYQNEIQTGVSVTSFMTAVTIFFVGILISKYDSFDNSIKIPILFLIISTFGFLYATLIVSNGSIEINSKNFSLSRFNRNMHIGDIIGEYLGVYLLVLSIPLVINAITQDVFLRYSKLLASLAGLIVYHISGFSILSHHFKKRNNFIFLVIVIFELALFFTQFNLENYFVIIASALVLYLCLIAILASKMKRE